MTTLFPNQYGLQIGVECPQLVMRLIKASNAKASVRMNYPLRGLINGTFLKPSFIGSSRRLKVDDEMLDINPNLK